MLWSIEGKSMKEEQWSVWPALDDVKRSLRIKKKWLNEKRKKEKTKIREGDGWQNKENDE